MPNDPLVFLGFGEKSAEIFMPAYRALELVARKIEGKHNLLPLMAEILIENTNDAVVKFTIQGKGEYVVLLDRVFPSGPYYAHFVTNSSENRFYDLRRGATLMDLSLEDECRLIYNRAILSIYDLLAFFPEMSEIIRALDFSPENVRLGIVDTVPTVFIPIGKRQEGSFDGVEVCYTISLVPESVVVTVFNKARIFVYRNGKLFPYAEEN